MGLALTIVAVWFWLIVAIMAGWNLAKWIVQKT